MEKPIVITADPSTQCGLGIGMIGGRPELSSVLLQEKGDTHEDVYGRASGLICPMFDRYRPILFAVEQPFYKNQRTNYATNVLLHGIYAVFVGAARARSITVWPVLSQTWRAAALGTSNFGSRDAAKEAMKAHCRRLGWDAVDDNAADAGGIWIWATAEYAPYGVLPGE